MGYNRLRFLIESLEDLNETFNKYNGCIRILRGDPVEIFNQIHEKTTIRKICFEQVINESFADFFGVVT